MPSGAVLYVRVSTEDQVTNLSLETQEKACREFCARSGLDVLDVFREEGASAKTANREQLQRLLVFVERNRKKLSAVVVYQLSRFSRNQAAHFALRLRLERCGVGLRSVTEPVDDSPTGRLLEGVVAAVAEFDNATKAERTKIGLQAALSHGRWTWVAPLGFRHAPRHADGRAGGLVLDELRAPLIRRAFERVAAGSTVEEARRSATEEGLRTLAGKPIPRQTFHRMLRHPLYAGRIVVDRWAIETESSGPAIVDEPLFLRVQRELNRRRPVRYLSAHRSEFPLRGIAHCACGRKLSGYRARGRGGKLYRHFRCPSCAVNVALRELEAAFERLLERSAARVEDVDLLDRMLGILADRRAEVLQIRLEEARRRHSAAQLRLDRLIEMRAAGEISVEEFSRARQAAAGDRDAARLDLEQLAPPAADELRAVSAFARRLLTDPVSVWRELGGEQRAVLGSKLFPSGITWSEGETSNRGKSLLDLPLPVDFDPGISGGTLDGIRTRVAALKGQCPRPG